MVDIKEIDINTTSLASDPLKDVTLTDKTQEQLGAISDRLLENNSITQEQRNLTLGLVSKVLTAHVDGTLGSSVGNYFTDPESRAHQNWGRDFKESVIEGAQNEPINTSGMAENISAASKLPITEPLDGNVLRWVGKALGKFATGGPVASLIVLDNVTEKYYRGKTPDWLRPVVTEMKNVVDKVSSLPPNEREKYIQLSSSYPNYISKDNPMGVQAIGDKVLTRPPFYSNGK